MAQTNEKFAATDPYYTHVHQPLLKACDPGFKKVLEIGCAGGATLIALKKMGAEQIFGVELREDVALMARANAEIDNVVVADIAKEDLPFELASFDLIVASFVLEHVIDPWTTLSKMLTYLKPGGQFVGTLPNVRHVSVMLPLIFSGKWDYQDDGIMDWTHAKFFTRKTIQDLLVGANLSSIKINPWINGRKEKIANIATLGRFSDWFCFAYVFSAVK